MVNIIFVNETSSQERRNVKSSMFQNIFFNFYEDQKEESKIILGALDSGHQQEIKLKMRGREKLKEESLRPSLQEVWS